MDENELAAKAAQEKEDQRLQEEMNKQFLTVPRRLINFYISLD